MKRSKGVSPLHGSVHREGMISSGTEGTTVGGSASHILAATGLPGAGLMAASAPRLVVPDQTLEVLKWLAVVLMTLDHINKFIYSERIPVLFEVGRLAMPLFGFVLVYNLSRPEAYDSGLHWRAAKRLALFGTLASPPFIAMVGWWPLNILFMLLLVVAITYLLEKRSWTSAVAALVVFIVPGSFVEFWWFGLAFCLAAWGYLRQPSWVRMVAWIVATASLFVVNRNLWALVALPIIFVAPHVSIEFPRFRWMFYTFYPAHLVVLFAMQRL